jgi:putative aldouronate transport system permease protein
MAEKTLDAIAENRSRSSIKKSPADRAFVICNTIFLVLFVVITLYPVLNQLAISFNNAADALRGGIYLWPRMWSTANYEAVLRKQNLLTGLYVSIARTVIGTVAGLFITALLAFICSRPKYLWKRQMNLFWVITMYVNGGLIPGFLLFKYLGLTNNFWVYIIPGLTGAFNMMVLRSYMENLPVSLEESAQLDGAGYMTIFIKIILPLCTPVLATVALFIAVYQWNSWFDVMLYNRMSPEYTTLQYELMKLLSSATNQGGGNYGTKTVGNMITPASIRAAGSILTMLPIVCLYPFLQRYFVTGMTLGAVKE